MSQQPTMFINATTTVLEACNESLAHFQYQPPSSFDIFTGVFMILIIITSLAGNILILYAFVTNPKLRVVNNYFIMNLTLSDILTASLVIPFDAGMKLNGLSSWSYGAVMCKIWTTAYTISVPTSILTLCTVSIDRYQAISNPLGYRAGVTLNKTKALCLIGGIWALSLFMAFLPFMVGSPLNVTLSRDLPPECPDVYFCYFDISPSYSAAVTIIAFILPSIVMATLYVRMYIIITYERYIGDENRFRGHGREMNQIGKNIGENDQEGSKKEGIKTDYAKNRNEAEINESERNKGENKQKERRLDTKCKSCNKKSGMNIAQNCQTRKKSNGNTTECDKMTTDKQRDQNGMKNQTLKTECDENNKNIQDAKSSNKTEQNVATIDQKVNENSGSDKGYCAKHKISENNQDTNNNKGNKRINKNNASNSTERNICKNERRCDRNSQNNHHSNNNESNRSQPFASNTSLRHHHATYQTKVAKHFSVIVLVQLVCWYPFSVATIVYNLCDGCYQISSSAQYFLLTIGYMSCAINPYLYAYQQRSFRHVFNQMFGMRS